MIELGQLEAEAEAFAKRNVRVVAVSIENQTEARLTQTEHPHLIVVADADRGLSNAVDVIHADSNPNGGDTSAPTTLLVDGTGVVRWMFRSSNVFTRASSGELFTAIDQHLKTAK